MRKTNPYEDKNLLATRNGLYFKQTGVQRASVAMDSRYNFGTSDWTISVIAQNIENPSGKFFNFAGQTKIEIRRVNTAQVNFEVQSAAGANILLSGFQTPDFLSRSTNMFTVIRRGTKIEAWINTVKKAEGTIGAGETFNFNGSGLRLGWGGDSIIDGLLANFIVVKYAASANEIQQFLNTSIAPSTWHQHIIGHYPMNQNLGLKLWDVVEQYNYSKVTPLTAIHGDLLGYTNDEVGITNPLLQTAWQNIYTKKKDGLNIIKFNGTDEYGGIDSLIGQTATGNFSIAILLYHDASIASTSNHLFFVQDGGSNFIQVYKDVPTSKYFLRLVGVSYSSPTVNIPFSFFTDKAVNTIVMHSRKVNQINTVFVKNAAGVVSSYNDNLTVNTYADLSITQATIGKAGTFGLFLDCQVGKVVWIEHAGAHPFNFYTSGAGINQSTVDLLTNRLLNVGESNDYKNYTRKVDIDFGDVFLDTGNYFARDNSGNNRHARLYNFVPATDLPLRLEQHTGVAEIVKGFKMTENVHFASVAAYSLPSSLAKGYTVTMAISCNANDFGNGQNVGFGNDIQQADWMLWFSTAAFVDFHGFGALRKGSTVSPFNMIFTQGGGTPATSVTPLQTGLNVDRPIELAWVIDTAKLKLKFYVDGILKTSISMTSFSTLFELVSTLKINQSDYGKESGAKTFIRANIFNAVLSDAELLESYNNGFSSNKIVRELKTSYIFTDESFYIDGADVKIKNSAPGGNQAHNMTIGGLVGATAADKLNDLKTNFLFTVDSLR